MNIAIALSGATGRMGQSIVRLAEQEQMTIVGAVASSQSFHLGKDVGDVAGAGHLGVAITDDVGAACSRRAAAARGRAREKPRCCSCHALLLV